MADELAEDVGRLYTRHGQQKVKQFFNKINLGNKEIPPSANTKRSMYNFTKASYPADVVISPSFIRSDVVLGTDNTYTFPVLKSDVGNGQGLPKTTVLLDQNDTFEMTKICVLLWTQPNNGATPPVATQLAQQSRLYSYPNPTVFAGAGESSALDGLYFGGRLLIEVGTDKVFPKTDLLRFYRVPTSQQGVVSAVNAAGTDSIIPYDGFNSEDFPWMDSIPGLTISGNGKYTFTVSIPEGTSLAAPAGQNRFNYMALYIRGFLCSNGAKQQNKKFSVTY